MVLAFIFTNTTSSAVLYNHPELINIFTRPALLVSQSLTTTYMILLVLVNANILVLVSYQTASIVEALESATKKIFEDLEPSRLRPLKNRLAISSMNCGPFTSNCATE